jgi:serine/threonine protein kinase
VTGGQVVRGQEVVIVLTLRMLCTTIVDIPLLVVVPEKGYATVHVHVESQLSTRLDPDEVTTGKLLGAGSFGTVYRGEWRGVDVAVKAYNESALLDVGLRQDIEREVEMCFKLRMPFIVTFYGRTISSNRLCIVMEYVHYGSLGAMIAKPDPILLKFKVRVALDVAKGMNFLHKNRVIHRDLKSDNVLIACLDTTAPVVAKLSDFNTSRFWGSEANRTKTKGVGTPVFMAPEIIDGKHYSWMADVYSYAMLLWNLWTQKEPYSNFESSFVFFMFVLEGNRLPIPPDLPDPLAAITRDCWKHIPEERPTFQAVVQRLDEIFPTIL